MIQFHGPDVNAGGGQATGTFRFYEELNESESAKEQRSKQRLDLRHRWADETTHLLFEPLELLERLAALTPRPRINPCCTTVSWGTFGVAIASDRRGRACRARQPGVHRQRNGDDTEARAREAAESAVGAADATQFQL
jgi:hypothetical protein